MLSLLRWFITYAGTNANGIPLPRLCEGVYLCILGGLVPRPPLEVKKIFLLIFNGKKYAKF